MPGLLINDNFSNEITALVHSYQRCGNRKLTSSVKNY